MVETRRKESVYANEIRKFQRLQEELVQLQEQLGQVELEQEQLRQEEVSSPAGTRAPDFSLANSRAACAGSPWRRREAKLVRGRCAGAE